MTLILAVRFGEGVIIATDKRTVTLGDVPLKRDEERKIEKIGTSVGLATAGFVGMINKVTQALSNSYSGQAKPPTERVAETCEDILWRLFQRYIERFANDPSGFPTVLVADHKTIFRIHSNGYAEECRDYACDGSGRAYAELILADRFSSEMSEGDALRLVVATIAQTATLDPFVSKEMCASIVLANEIHDVDQTEIEKIRRAQAIAPQIQSESVAFVTSIAEHRRWINQLCKSDYGFELFQSDEWALVGLLKPCFVEDDFTNLIANLSMILEHLNSKGLKGRVSASVKGTLNLLQKFLEEEECDRVQSIVGPLRDLVTLRSKKRPIHRDNPKAVDLIIEWGHHVPPEWDRLWSDCLGKFEQALGDLKEWLEDRKTRRNTVVGQGSQ